MSESLETTVREICASYENDRSRMMDIVRDVQERFGHVSGEAMELIAREAKTHRVEVESVVAFYSFLSDRPKGKVVIRLCDGVSCRMNGAERLAEAFEQALGVSVGQTTPDGKITLERTACMGMCGQGPAAMVDEVVLTQLSTDSARQVVRELKEHLSPRKLVHKLGDGNNASALVHAMVVNNVRKAGPVVLADMPPGEALKKALAMTPTEVIRDIKTARLRGRGGAGFPTGMKWDFTRSAVGEPKFVICNADEGEPGTFKDRVILTEKADLLFEGMTIGGYAIGAKLGILYLRGEYEYLRRYLEHVLAQRREAGLLGKAICGRSDVEFDIRIQMGAGAYICGEETALISSCEGRRGDPKDRPPFPAQQGYLAKPTTVNNVETFCCVARILEMGPGWFAQFGSRGSPGTKLLSISGDCTRPGVYEVEMGIPLREVLELAGAEEPAAVQIGGPSGQMVGPEAFDRTVCYDDLATGGSIIIFAEGRELLEIVAEFMEFFIDESCGYCTPCRVGNVLLKERLDRILAGKGQPGDLDYLCQLGETIKVAARCGLGQTSPNPILSTLENFRSLYESRLTEAAEGFQPSFDLAAALGEAEGIAGRKSVHLSNA